MEQWQCEQHTELIKSVALIQNDLKYIREKVCRHIEDGEKEGGWRDRLLLAEQQISTIKKGYWKACAVSGIIGGLIGKLTPDVLSFVVKIITGGL